ncbi:energy-coupling factor transport system ATP-binding protein [Geomicrobium halophilum]|uniref:Energy-coupling factor transporter ATP-binding protein EcfA2 n=1 Tax=Geomicrobium halophilum TaxID=549000 RepID=A0A841PXN2_9BACL|nr:energy-coupling factor transporter ATPase [Geomicrobium halophilum]MBB6451491.1 energy-coupling factor transport system ATP-binding protein [Geomicrobium halophilum]
MRITFRDVSYTYMIGSPFEKKALDAVNLTLSSQTFTGVVGSTGSGKSTLMQLINGLLLPTTGQVQNGDFILHRKSKRKYVKQVRRQVGMVFQYPEHQLFGSTVEEDMLFGPKHLGLDIEKSRQRFPDLLELVGLGEEILPYSPFSLSGGQMRRVAIAGVLATHPKVLILDEPAAGLDPAGHRALLDLLRDWHDQHGLTTVLVTHDMEDAARYADEIVVMDEGKPVISGAPTDVFRQADQLAGLGLDVPASVRVSRAMQAAGWEVADTLLEPEALAGVVIDQLSTVRKEG